MEGTPLKEPPPKPPEHIVNKEVALDVAPSQIVEGEPKAKTIVELYMSSQLVEGKPEGTTIIELLTNYLSENEEEQLDQPLESPTSENNFPHTNSMHTNDISLPSNDFYKSQTYDDCSEELGTLVRD